MRFTDRGRQYAIDDEDFQLYKQRGGSMTMAEFFNEMLGLDQTTRPGFLEKRLCDSMGGRHEPRGNLENRIRLHMMG